MNPKGFVDSRRSIPQPITAPTRTPATNSDESLKPRAMAEARDAPSPPSLAGWSVLSSRLSRSADSRWSRLPSLAESAASSGDFSRLPFPRLSVPSAMCGDPTPCCWKQKLRPSPSKAARTILRASTRVKITSQLPSLLIQFDFSNALGPIRGPVAALQTPVSKASTTQGEMPRGRNASEGDHAGDDLARLRP